MGARPQRTPPMGGGGEQTHSARTVSRLGAVVLLRLRWVRRVAPTRSQRENLARRYDCHVVDPILARTSYEVKVRSLTALRRRAERDRDVCDMRSRRLGAWRLARSSKALAREAPPRHQRQQSPWPRRACDSAGWPPARVRIPPKGILVRFPHELPPRGITANKGFPCSIAPALIDAIKHDRPELAA
jgi:hypothetical protein